MTCLCSHPRPMHYLDGKCHMCQCLIFEATDGAEDRMGTKIPVGYAEWEAGRQEGQDERE